MKQNIKILIIMCAIIVGISSCNYLDVVPDERPTDKDAFMDRNAAERYLYSCYAYLPNPRMTQSSLDFLTGDEVVTAFEHETFASFPKGNYSASNPVISYWNTFFQGLRQCYLLINGIDQVPGLDASIKEDYIAQAKFLIGYYHFLLIRAYGPVILIKEEPKITTASRDYLGRTNYDECVQFVCDLMDESAKILPDKRPIATYGLATKIAAKSIKAQMLLYAASPLFNGNSNFYSDFVDKEGNNLMTLSYDANKWIKAKQAYLEAIQAAESAGHSLYKKTDFNRGNTEPKLPLLHCLRYNIMDSGNEEIIWADSRAEGSYGLQNKSLPFTQNTWNGVAPTLAMLKRFYTKNGLPIDKDTSFNQNYWSVVTIDSDHEGKAAVGESTISFNLNREPRYYAWIAFQGGFYEVLSSQSNGGYSNDASYRKYSDMENFTSGKLVCNFVAGGNCSRLKEVNNPRTNNYSPTGFLNKKGVDPANAVSTNFEGRIDYPWPIIRLADLYLGYAETCVETNDLPEAIKYLDKVRERAGIPSTKQSWEEMAGETLTQNLLRNIVRQERMIELYLENQNFWDMRRWLLAEKYFGTKAKGMNIDGKSIEEYARETEVIFERKFNTPAHYLMPIPLGDVEKNEKLVNNPGY